MDIQHELNKAKEILMEAKQAAAEAKHPKAAVAKLGKLIGQLEALQKQFR
ncbi:hypothetical protein L0Z02_29430 (plasmid) [Burkholderia multivorans]|uniref:Uncharacterized protein n=1 Tax=Burkholderia multivorans TaxID=87883 RepID=A0AAP2HQ92_9BURK|nr:hypothetical protein [Burkholderia multivorans]MBU9360545.1 hypothetical protein [Burkholderia multivorans]MCO1459924.1 hypothetical protein [Burkholderia multivorans]MCO1459983.1 hypothetical protein [Burkholderia multivorans]UQO21335.1 hypothetical protein L0Z02_29430 [Burkholderia multivorans]